jgi:hypothetical protein
MQLSLFDMKPSSKDGDADSDEDLPEVINAPKQPDIKAPPSKKRQIDAKHDINTEKRSRSVKDASDVVNNGSGIHLQTTQSETVQYTLGDRVRTVGRYRDANKEAMPYGTFGTVTAIVQIDDDYYFKIAWDSGQPSSYHLPMGFWAVDTYDVK